MVRARARARAMLNEWAWMIWREDKNVTLLHWVKQPLHWLVMKRI